MLPCIITSFVGTVAALVIVSILTKDQPVKRQILIAIGGIVALISALLTYITRLDLVGKDAPPATSQLVCCSALFSRFSATVCCARSNSRPRAQRFSTPSSRCLQQLAVGRIIFPYILGILVAISLFRNSGLFEIFAGVLAENFSAIHVNEQIVNALPIAILRPFNSAGSRGFPARRDGNLRGGLVHRSPRLCFSMRGRDDFYVVAVYFGSVKIKHTRYAINTMLLVDLVCVCAAIFVCLMFFQLPGAGIK